MTHAASEAMASPGTPAAPPAVPNPDQAVHDQAVDDQAVHAQLDLELEPGGPDRTLTEEKLGTPQLITIGYLVIFSLLGTWTRLQFQSLTPYSEEPAGFMSIWANIAGCLVIGVLSEAHLPPPRARGALLSGAVAVQAVSPLYVGLTTGFCGSLTSFSGLMRDMFLALTNGLVVNTTATTAGPRPPRRGLVAALAVLVTTVFFTHTAFELGTHSVIFCRHRALVSPSFRRLYHRPTALLSKITSARGLPILVPILVPALALALWLGAAVTAAVTEPAWSGRAVATALAFAPLGCLLRFTLALALNGRSATFPLGTFIANVAGTAILAAAWDGAHLPAAAGSATAAVSDGACVVLVSGLQDGFCGCLTTVSTWVLEKSTMPRYRAYIYSIVSIGAAWAVVVSIMGGLRWTSGFATPTC